MNHPVRSNRISSYILFAVVALAPLPFGSADDITIAIWCIILGLAAVAATPRSLKPGQLALLGCAGVLVAAYALVLHEQLSAHPWFAAPDPVWRDASEALGTPLQPSVSIARNQPFFALGAPVAAMLTMICSFIVCADRRRAHQLLKVVAWSGAAYAAFAILAFALDPMHILWRTKQAYQTVLTGTFINRNTASVYFGMCSVLWLLLLTEKVREQLPSGRRDLARSFDLLLSGAPRDAGVSFVMLFMCLAAMFMTGSRAGILLSLMVIVLAVVARFYREVSLRRRLLVVVAIGVIISLVLLQVMGAGVSARLDEEGLADGGRFETYRATWQMAADHPWFGTGLGTFPWGFPAYRSSAVTLWGVWDRAHDTLLEIAAEMGLPFAALVIGAWILIFGVLTRGILARRRDVSIPVVAFASAILAVLHSLIDFSLQIPGYTIVVFALVGAGLAQSFSSGRTTQLDPAIGTAIETPVVDRDVIVPRALETADGPSNSNAAKLP